jgi:citrate lyase subunit beta / citryl-CoA lyase
MPTIVRPRCSVLFMPGSNDSALERAKTLPADALIFDLEDAMAPDAKETARQMVCDAVRAGGYGKRELIVRVNASATVRGDADLASARKIIAAHADTTAQGNGLALVDARLIEHLHVEEAQRLVALAEVIAVLEAEASS